MQHRNLGSQGLRVSALGLGIMGMSMGYGASNDDEGIATIRRAHEVGIDFFDTAELYGAGTGSNEILLGKAVKDFRDEVVLATKFGFDMTAPLHSPGFDSRPENIRKVAENSLRYLQSDHIDLFYQHISDPDVPVEEVAGAVGELITEGKVKYFGLSNVGPQYIRRAHAVTPVSVLQYEYSLFEREVEEKTLPVLRELGIGLVPYSPARPRLPHRPGQTRRRIPRGRHAQLGRALAGRELHVQRARHRTAQDSGRHQGHHHRPARAGLAACPGRGHRAHPRHPQHQAP